MGRKSSAKKNRTTPSVGQQRRAYISGQPERLRLEAERKEHERDQRIAGQIRTEAWRRTFCCWPSPHACCKSNPLDMGFHCPRRAPWVDALPICLPVPLLVERHAEDGDVFDAPKDAPAFRRRGRSLGALLALAAASGALSMPSPGPYRGPGR
jgi:hypothetical protein